MGPADFATAAEARFVRQHAADPLKVEIKRFDSTALYAALHRRRQAEGLSWQQLGWGCPPARSPGIDLEA